MREPLCPQSVAVRKAIAILVSTVFLTFAVGCGSSSNPTSGPAALWVTNSAAHSVDAFSIDQLSAGGNVAPTVDISGTNTGFGEPSCVAFDRHGNLWVVDFVGSLQYPFSNVSQLEEFPASSLSSGGNLTPAVTISGSNTTLGSGGGCQFDSAGNFWVANGFSAVAFSPWQLRFGGNIAPAIQISGSNNGTCIADLAFDKSGNLWASNPCSGGSIVEFKASDLPAGGNVSPVVTITLPPSTFTGTLPLGLTFDSSGNLWVADHQGGTVTEYKASDLSSGGNITPAVTIASIYAAGVTFDSKGNLWVSRVLGTLTTGVVECSSACLSDALIMYSQSDIAAGGNITPTMTITAPNINLLSPMSVLFH